jgi:putative nucleotidyltransferase with HDIG domain
VGYPLHRNTTANGVGAEEPGNLSKRHGKSRLDSLAHLEEAVLLVADSAISACLDRPDSLEADPEWQEAGYIEALARRLIEILADGPDLEKHCHRLALLVSLLGVEMGLDTTDLQSLRRGAYLHDIGKIGIPSSILLKRGPLDEEEWCIMRKHPLIGEQICRDLPSMQGILPIIRSHHERWDGTGYPDGLREKEIPLLARITQMADIYDALTAERPYKSAFSPEKALETIREEGLRGWRDPNLVRIVENLFPIFKTLPPDGTSSLSLQALSGVVRRRSWF